jgi:probable HAF family extracellular repeat protein
MFQRKSSVDSIHKRSGFRRRGRRICASAVAAVELLETRRLFSVEYSITDLGTLGGSASAATAINASGEVVGNADTAAGAEHAFIYANGAMIDLGTLTGGSASNATAINSSGEVVGESTTSGGATHAVEFGGSTVIDLGTDGTSGSEANGINDSGTIVGALVVTSDEEMPFIDVNGTITMLPVSTPQNTIPLGAALGISNPGGVVGTYGYSEYVNGFPTILQPFPATWSAAQVETTRPLFSGYTTGQIVAINSTGSEGAGSGENQPLTGPTTYEAAYWNASGVTPIGTLPGATSSSGHALNDNDDIVGSSLLSSGSKHAFLYQQNGAQTMLDLNDLIPANSGWTLNVATGINDIGQICGTGEINGVSHAFLLTPTTSTFATLAGGTLTVTGTPEPDTISFAENAGTVTAILDGQSSQAFTGVTDIVVTGGAGNDTITLAGTTEPATVHGNAGDDVIVGNDAGDSLTGNVGNDNIKGGAGNDTITGAAGNDTLKGAGGDDSLAGGADNDVLKGNAGNNTLNGGAGTNALHGGVGNDTFYAVTGTNDEIFADTAVNDTVYYNPSDAYIIETGVIPAENQILAS